ncbi:type VI secretion system tip protein VgrG [bacterium SCSIO 12741]|nr:type VI secretion system tip protein VgrG [bacterium SCSIO 12741]
MSAPSPVNENTDLVSFTILVGGSEIDGSYQVARIEVDKAINRVPSATVVIQDGNPATENFPISDSSTFVPGSEIEIKAGYHNTNETIFKGLIMGQKVSIYRDQGSTLTVECRDKSVKITSGRKNAYFQKKKDSDIISQLISDGGLSADVDSTSVQHEELIQYYSTDWDFIVSRAEVNGLIVVADAGTVGVKKPEVSGSAVLGLTYGDDIWSFDGTINARAQIESVRTTSWDPATQRVINASSSEPSVNSQGNITGKKMSDVMSLSEYELQTPSPLPQDELKAWADAQLLRSRLASNRGSVSFQGSSLVKPNTLIELNGVGERFNGTAFVSAVHHEVEDSNWTTTVEFGLQSHWFYENNDINEPPASGLIPALTGLQIGVVKQIDKDPDNAFRVLVTLPMIQSGDDGVWARLGSNFYATNGAGSFFYPEVGDEVVLGFLNDNPTFPIILGSMYSGKYNPAFTPDDKNSIKAITTKSQLQLEFNDEKKIITIQTPGGNKMIWSDDEKSITIQDQNGNKAIFNDSGIELNSAKNITIKASQNVEISGVEVTAKGSSKLSGSGEQVSFSADSTFSASGSASAEVKASGNLTLKGSMVSIN